MRSLKKEWRKRTESSTTNHQLDLFVHLEIIRQLDFRSFTTPPPPSSSLIYQLFWLSWESWCCFKKESHCTFCGFQFFCFFQTLSWPALGWLGCTSPLSWIEITNTSAQYHHHFSVMNCFYLAIIKKFVFCTSNSTYVVASLYTMNSETILMKA